MFSALVSHGGNFTEDERKDFIEAVPAEEAVVAFAEDAGLRYVHDFEPGFTRRRAGRGFAYFTTDGKRVEDGKISSRLKSIVIPPAWQNVWVCRHANGHLQVTGRDARGRKQYLYHPKWAEARNETKFGKLRFFGECLPVLRKKIEADLAKPGLSREKILAAAVKVMEITRIRVGNDAYANDNDSFGLTTIRNRHAQVIGSQVKFKFRGKSGIRHKISFQDRRLSRIIRRCQELPGEELFAYEDRDGRAHDITSGDVNDYLKSILGEGITAKDIRTWGGTVRAVKFLAKMGPTKSKIGEAARRRRNNETLKEVAGHLGNTVAICRKYYVHPTVFEADRDGSLHKIWAKIEKFKAGDAYELEELVTLAILRE